MAIRRDLPNPRSCTPTYYPGNANPNKVYVAYNGPRAGIHAHFSTLEKTKELQYQALEPWKVSSVWRSRCLNYHPDCRTHPRQSDNPWSFEAFSQDTSNSIARDRDLAEAFARGATIEDGAQPQPKQDAVSTARQLGRSYRAAPSAPPTLSQADLGPSTSAARNVVDVDDENDSGDAGDLGEDDHTFGPSFTSHVNVTIQSNCGRIPRGPQPVSRAALSHTTPARPSQPSRAHPSRTSQDAAGTRASAAQPSRIYGASSSANSSSISQAGSSARSRSTSPRKPRGPSFTVILAVGHPAVITIDEQRVLELMRSFTAAGARPRLQRAGLWEQALSLVPDLEVEEGDVFFVLERDGDTPCAVMDRAQARRDMRREAADRPVLHIASSFEDMMNLMDDLV